MEYYKRYVIECRIVEGISSDLSFLLAFTYINRPNVNAIYSTEHKAWRIHFSAQNKTVYYRRVRVYKSERELHVIANKCK
ncbi:hypothetical protein [Thermaurantimonas aggregans]|uniref:hypothetical protein n=1 Tax=Thermaurantimonas aggregans TaxID=2173829 RepID=UPI0023EF60C6|nr:hypothetical protein [Thermaurantimonas aggregans]MCX8149230.1 hypothetical protein [Thermaurantimonas aggregans]